MPFRLGVRAAVTSGAYLVTALAAAVAILVLRRTISPAALQGALGFFFIAAIAAGIEPATVKAAVLRGGPDGPLPATGASVYLAVGAVKALAAAPLLAILWRFADPRIPLADLLWLPAVALAGFAATDLRVLFDLRGRHAAAIWLKQGSLAGGLAVLAVLVGAGLPLFWAIGVSTGARLGLVAWVVAALPSGKAPVRFTLMRRLLGDVRWMELAAASVVAALSGSTDRILALRYLPAPTYASYFLLYELFSRFWLLPYLLTPILFARLASGRESTVFIRRAWLGTAAAGAAFVAAAAGAVFLTPALLDRFVGTAFGPPAIAFAAAVVIGALTQLRIAELQGRGAARRAIVVVGLCAVFSAVAFFVMVRHMGATGLMMAWLVKSVVELAAAIMGGRPGLDRERL
ncbi:MAG: hypothetical protein ABI306_07320 [Caulobacteraceae bacterium]